MSKKRKNKNSVTNVNANNEEGRIMSMLNGMMNGGMNGGGNIMNNQFTNPNISTQRSEEHTSELQSLNAIPRMPSSA